MRPPRPLRAPWWGVAAAALGALVWCSLAWSRPPSAPDPLWHAWFEQQHSRAGAWCCNIADGHILSDQDWQMTPNGYRVRWDGVWRDVPADALRDPAGGPNPTGQAILWVYGGRVWCFAPGTAY